MKDEKPNILDMKGWKVRCSMHALKFRIGIQIYLFKMLALAAVLWHMYML